MGVFKLEHSNLAQHQAGLVQRLRQLWMEDHLCDVVLKSHDGAEHRAHTTLLSAASVVFRKLLSGSFLEADRVKSKQPVEIAASTTALTVLLDFIYGGQPEVPVEAGLELLRLAEAYDLPKFAAAIEAGLLASLDSTNALQVLQEAHGLHDLKDACEKKVAENFEAYSQHPDFGKLSAGQLARILKRGDLKVSREEVVLKSIFNWLNVSKDQHAFCMLLQHVDFQSFSFENLLHLGRCALLGPNCEELQREVNEALSLQRKRAQDLQNSQVGLHAIWFCSFPLIKWEDGKSWSFSKLKLPPCICQRSFSRRGVVSNIGRQIWVPALTPGEKCRRSYVTLFAGTAVPYILSTGREKESSVGSLVSQQPAKTRRIGSCAPLESMTWGISVTCPYRPPESCSCWIIATEGSFGFKMDMVRWCLTTLTRSTWFAPPTEWFTFWSPEIGGRAEWCRSWSARLSRQWLPLSIFQEICSSQAGDGFSLPKRRWSISQMGRKVGFYASTQLSPWNLLWWDNCQSQPGSMACSRLEVWLACS